MEVAPREEWREFPGFAGLYEISDTGRVRTVATGRIRKQFPVSNGYMQVMLCRYGEKVNVRVHRAVCEAFNGAPPTAQHHAGHNDGDRLNNSAANLRWVTGKENQADRVRHGTHVRGEKQYAAKITETQALNVIEQLNRGGTHRGVAASLGLSRGLVNNIALKRSWKHLSHLLQR